MPDAGDSELYLGLPSAARLGGALREAMTSSLFSGLVWEAPRSGALRALVPREHRADGRAVAVW